MTTTAELVAAEKEPTDDSGSRASSTADGAADDGPLTTPTVENDEPKKAGHYDASPEEEQVLQLLRGASSCSDSSGTSLLLLDLQNLYSSTSSACLQNMTTLNLSHTAWLSYLPDNFADAFPQLSILFLSHCSFAQVPAVIGKCLQLQMVAFKSNRHSNNNDNSINSNTNDKCLTSIHPDALQPQLRWLILTDNAIAEIPATIGRCTRLQKLMLSGNAIATLPDDMCHCCTNLELIRLASNGITNEDGCIVKLLQGLPKLSWIGLSDNPFLSSSSKVGVLQPQSQPVVLEDLDESLLENAEVLGRGAGGITYKLQYQGQWVAVKQFGSEMTSDGLPSQERSISCQVSALAATEKQCCTTALIRVLGETKPSQCLVLEYLDKYHAMAAPPSLESCSRDVYENSDDSRSWTPTQAVHVLASLLSALVELHRMGICHGDFYGHNILIKNNARADSDAIQVRLTDFGAAFIYDTTANYGKLLSVMELRAFAHLVQEVVDHYVVGVVESQEQGAGAAVTTRILTDLVATCHKPGATLDAVYIWLKQNQLKAMASAFDVQEDDNDEAKR